MATVNTASNVQAEYAQKVADDLAINQVEQDRVRAELARLQEELFQLEGSEQVLVKMQAALGVSSTPKPKPGRKAAKIPATRSPKSKRVDGKAAHAPKTDSKPARRGENTAKNAGSERRVGEPTWVELIGSYLARQSEPKSSAEIAAAVAEEHPQREVQVPVVRNTLELSVARGLVERHKQGRSVYYQTAPAGEEAADSSDTVAA
ncbi:hypothetical protein [Streptomyces sp. NPDC060022]|uniref:hypothetical protein n=1 Tax=Streptomyces sp. NPDC060022 TaxID=3347039 RepID=UPI00369F44BE